MGAVSVRSSILLFGGTFNPIHLGHLFAAELAREALGFGRVVFVPSHTSPHRGVRDLAAPADRLAMAKLAVDPAPPFAVWDGEVVRGGVSYAADTVRAFRKAFPRARIGFLLGLDAALELHTWKDFPEILRDAELVVVSRPSTAFGPREKARWTRALRVAGPSLSSRIKLLPLPALPISATEVRARVARGLSIRYHVPDAVRRYIARRKLYQGRR